MSVLFVDPENFNLAIGDMCNVRVCANGQHNQRLFVGTNWYDVQDMIKAEVEKMEPQEFTPENMMNLIKEKCVLPEWRHLVVDAAMYLPSGNVNCVIIHVYRRYPHKIDTGWAITLFIETEYRDVLKPVYNDMYNAILEQYGWHWESTKTGSRKTKLFTKREMAKLRSDKSPSVE